MRTENEIFIAFCNVIEAARDFMGVPGEWDVLLKSPQNMVSVDRVILVNKISERRRGFQNTRFEEQVDGRIHEIWEWIEEYRFQVSCTRMRRLEDDAMTVTADEVAARLQAYINSDEGAEKFRENGIAPLFVFDKIPQDYTDENDVYQYFTHFDVAVQAVQEKDVTPPVVEAHELGIRHVPPCPGEGNGVYYDSLA